MTRHANHAGLWLLIAILAAPGCSPAYHAEDADRQVYGILKAGHEEEFGGPRPFTIADGPSRNASLSAEEIIGPLPEAGPLPEWLAASEMARLRGPLREIDLAAAMRLARGNSREFQARKETVYLTALDLTSRQYAFEWQYGLSGSVMRTVEGEERIRTLSTGADFSLTRELTTGAIVALDVGLTGLKYLNHELGTTLQSALSLSVAQPLWRGSDRTVVMNDLIQAQRDVIYALRSFTRYEKQFAVDVASSYYNVLLQLDRVKNEWNNYRNLTAARERNEWLAKAGRIQILELDQARQSELRAENNYLTAVQRYEQQLDSFRLLLGLPTDAPVVLSRRDLEALSEYGVRGIDIDSEAAVQAALVRRLDLKNTRGAVEDADRDVLVAADALKGDVDFVAGMNVDSTPETRAGRLMFHEGLYEFGLEVDLPLDRLNERNNFRESLINYDAAVRRYIEQVDGVKQEIRDALRQLKRTEQTHRISQASVELAQRRVEGTTLEMEAERATTRDLLESQDALVNAQNSLSEALVSHRIARLEFQRDLELMEVDEEGQIHETDILQMLGAAKDAGPGQP